MMPSYRAEVVGSLLRPDYLLEARRRLHAGRLSLAEFKRIEDAAVDEAIALQDAAGVDVLTDGEQRRHVYFGHLLEALDGFPKSGGSPITFRNERDEQFVYERPVVVEKLTWRRNMNAEEFTYLRAQTKRLVKATLASPQLALLYYDPDRSRSAYPTQDAYLADIVDFMRREIQELIRLGCTYIQIDAPQYASFLDSAIREDYRRRGADPDRLLDIGIELDNALIAGDSGVTFALHVCRGNARGMFFASGGYEPIGAKLFRKTKFHRLLLEYDDERSGTFEPLRHVPDDRTVVLGLVTTKRPRLESLEELQGRIAEAAKIVALDRLALSAVRLRLYDGKQSPLRARPEEKDRTGRRDGSRRLGQLTQIGRRRYG